MRPIGLAFVAFSLQLAAAAHAGAGPEAAPPAGACDLRHPIDVRIAALDPVRRGGAVRARVVVTSDQDLHDVRLDLVRTGGVRVTGATQVALGKAAAGQAAETTYQLALPPVGRRFLLVFRVQARGTAGTLSREATFNLLPDGPADPGTPRVTPDGRNLVEYSARRGQ
jgi:hypothetical protein